MTLDFAENIHDDIRLLFSNFEDDYRNLGVEDDLLNDITLRVNEAEHFECNITGNHIVISQLTIEIIWAITYAHFSYFELFVRNSEADGQRHDLMTPEWAISKAMLEWAKDELTNNSLSTFNSNNFPRTFTSDITVAIVFRYALLFFIGHEIYHVKNREKYARLMEEENQCDLDALKLILNSNNDNNYLLKVRGISIGLMVLNVYGIHNQNYDGITHPYTYDRIIENLSLFFGAENRTVWWFVVALFALHMTEERLVDVENRIHNNCYECILYYKTILEEHRLNRVNV